MKLFLTLLVLFSLSVLGFSFFTEMLSMLNGDTFSMYLAIIGFGAAAAGAVTLAVRKVQKAKSLLQTLVVLPLVFGSGCACERIEPGHVGIKIELAGSNRGVQNMPIVTGWVFYNPMTQDVLEYPTYVQTASWAKSQETNEEISFNSKEGLVLTGDISLSYQLKDTKVPEFYVKFRSDDLATFTHGYLRNVARDQFNEIAGTYAVEELYGPKKEEFVHKVKDRINKETESIGVKVEQFGFIGAPRPPENVIAAINAKIAATQSAIQAENELRRAVADAKKTVATAQGAADSAYAMAQGSAKSKLALAEADAEANRKLQASISEQLLAWRRLEIQEKAVGRWDGKRPMVEGGESGMLLQVSPK
jgi:regulator of protease activity HflC (stomatin/prohibitin superfamily)